MDQIIYNSKMLEKPIWLNSFGDYNSPPTPYVLCSSHEYWKKRQDYTPSYIDNKQLINFEKKAETFSRKAIVEYYHDCAFMILPPIRWSTEKFIPYIVYHDPPKYYLIGCEHTIKELSYDECYKKGIYHGGKCYHVTECTKCGFIIASDSSD